MSAGHFSAEGRKHDTSRSKGLSPGKEAGEVGGAGSQRLGWSSGRTVSGVFSDSAVLSLSPSALPPDKNPLIKRHPCPVV